MDKIIHIWLNDWSDTYCPPEEPFVSWLGDEENLPCLIDGKWLKGQKGVTVCHSLVDMSINIAITATEEWVKQNCPVILTDRYRKKFTEECVFQDEDMLRATFGTPFMPLEPATEGRLFYWDYIEDKIYGMVYDSKTDDYVEGEQYRKGETT